LIKQTTLLIDIESTPIISYNWGLYEQDAIKRIKTFTILSVAYKWLGGKCEVLACDKMTEKQLLLKLHKLLNEAEIVVAHNGDAFDIKKINARFIIHQIHPPSPYRTIDTKKVAKSVAAFDSNSLNNLGIDLDEGEKVKHRGFDMWEGCMAGNKRDWADMKRYNMQDVELLERIYLRLRPWIKNHPNMGVYSDEKVCPKCGSIDIHLRGFGFNNSGKFQRIHCLGCGAWSRSRLTRRLVDIS